MQQFLTDNKLWWMAADENTHLTYIQALELINRPVPHSARERSLLNVFARLPMAQPLKSTLLICDISQAVNMCHMRTDGAVPTKYRNAKLWSMRAGRSLSVSEMANLRGHDLSTADLGHTSSNDMMTMLSMSMHVATAGFGLIGLLAAFGSS